MKNNRSKSNKNLVEEIKKNIIDENVNLSTILRKAKLLAFELKSDDLKKWIDNELNGYNAGSELPDYRKIHAQSFGIFSGPYRSRIDNMIIPTYNLPDSIKEFAEEIFFAESIKELESLAQAEKTLQRKWPAEAIILARDKIQVSGGHVLVDAWQPITRTVLIGILDAVRNRLLDFLLDLQTAFPQIVESEESFKEVPNDSVNKILNVNVFGNHNILATGDDINQKVITQVKQNDIESLLSYLKNLKVADEDLSALKDSIASDGERKDNQFGERVKDWLGKMLIKANEGTWTIAVQTAAILLSSALQSYYGL